ncbi:MAG: septal ring lytic transglycosylase RlpA family protein [Acidimicrobiia bacterium]
MRFPTALLMVGALVIGAAPAFAQSETAAAERLAELRVRRTELQHELDSRHTRFLAASAAFQASRLQLQAARARHADLMEELARAREGLHAVEERLAERARQMYMSGEQVSVALFLSLTTLEDLDKALEYLAQVAELDAGLLEGLRSRRAEVERLEKEAGQVVARAEADDRAAEQAYQQARALFEGTRREVEVMETRIANLDELWAAYRLGLAHQLIGEIGPSGGLRDATLAQAELRASLPLGPTQGVPPGLRSTGRVLTGVASWYGPGFHGRRAASGALYDERDFTVAHRTLAHETLLLVSYGDRAVVVMVNDRGPYVEGREFDLSRAAAEYLGLALGDVTAEVLVVAD